MEQIPDPLLAWLLTKQKNQDSLGPDPITLAKD